MTSREKNYSMIRSYIEFMFISPVTTWWGAVTFGVEVIAFLLITETVVLTRVGVLILLFLVSFSLFVGFMVIYKGWSIYSKAYDKIRVTQIVRIDNEQYFLLACSHSFKIGSMFEVYRKKEDVEVPIGFIEVIHQRDDSIIQAKPIWILPVHLRDIENHELSVYSLAVYPTFSSNTLPRWIDEQAERKVKELLKRGQE